MRVVGQSRRSPDRFGLHAALGFGVWTALCQFVVFVGGSLQHLLGLVAVVGLAALAFGVRRLRRRHPGAPGLRDDGDVATSAGASVAPKLPDRRSSWSRALVFLIGLTLLITGGWLGWKVQLLWALAVVTVVAAMTLPDGEDVESRSSGAVEDGVLLLVGLACAILTLFSHYSSLDDAFYVNVALHVAQEPGTALLAKDTIFGIEGMPLQLPIYRLHSVEVLGGAISYLTGLRAILSMHWIVATLAAFLVPLAQARLLRRLLPEHWLGATILSSMVVFAWGGENLAVGNLGFVHLYQGKAIFTVLFVPLLLAEGLDFGVSPSRGGWIRLLLLQVAAVGMTWMALALGPILVVTAVVAGAGWRHGRRILVASTTSLYCIVVGIVVRGAVHGNPVEWESVEDVGAIMWGALHVVIGHGPWLLLVLLASLSAWASVRSPAARRLLLLLPLVFLLVLFNPWLVPRVAEELGNNSVFARVFWVLPLPLWMAIGFYLPSRWWRPRRRGILDVLVVGVAAVLVHVAMPQHTLSRANLTVMDWPREKVPVRDYEMAKLLVEHTPPGKTVLAPPTVAAWVTTIEHHPPVIYSRHNYYPFLEWQVGKVEAQRRRLWSRVSEGLGRLSIPAIRTMVTDYGVAGICVKIPEKQPKGPLAVLKVLGFEMVGRQRPYSVWILDKPLPPPRKSRRRQ